MEDAPPSGTPLPNGSDTQHEDAAGPSSSRAPAREFSREKPVEVPKDPLEDFTVPQAGTLFGEGSFTPSGSFSWIPDLGPMLDEIWAEESFKWLSKEPL